MLSYFYMGSGAGPGVSAQGFLKSLAGCVHSTGKQGRVSGY
jgi:hypothetical protein